MQRTTRENTQRAIAVMTAYLEQGPENTAFASAVATDLVNEEDGVAKLVSGFVILTDHLLRDIAKLTALLPDSVAVPPKTTLQLTAETFANREDDE